MLKGVRTCADPRKLQLGQAHKVCRALASGCTALCKHGQPFAVLQRLFGLAAFYTGRVQHSVLVKALPGSADRDVGRPSICPMTLVMWLELAHIKHRCFVLMRSSPNPAGVMHGVALHSHALCYFAEGRPLA